MKKVVLSLAFVAAVFVSCKDQAAEAPAEAPVMEEAVVADSAAVVADSAAVVADSAATEAAATATEEVKK
ncbi:MULTISPECIES: hypothetical protein [unclassified Flavobacterium]|uniref:hypothetical protein n=1 Tax=unclassified Flavobacterium TaxID=196869 RepID=UPI003619D283